MKAGCQNTGGESGSALLIAIFALLLVSVVGIALLVSTGADSALAGNYRNSTASYYAAMSGLEEARGRLLPRNPNFIGNTPGFPPGFPPPPSGSQQWNANTVVYIINPANSETVNPTDSSNLYYDKEYNSEFPWGLGGANVLPLVNSIFAPSANPPLPGPSYKWVRINPPTEQAINVDVNGNGSYDPGVLFYDFAHVDSSDNVSPGLMVSNTLFPPTPPNATSAQVLEITALAVMPDKTTKLLQYIVSPVLVFPNLGNSGFPAGLTLLGYNVQYTGPGSGSGPGGSSSFYIRGQDQCSGSNTMVPAIGFANSGDNVGSSTLPNILAQATPGSNYLGAPVQSPGPPPVPSNRSVEDVTDSVQPGWLNPKDLDAIVQTIASGADVVINGNATGSTISTQASGMSASNPMTIVVNGDLNLNAWHNTGYGLLLVTGTLYYDPDATWEGLVLVIGQGNFVSTAHGTGGIDGSVLVAKTRDAAGNLLSSLGSASYSQTGNGANSGRGINYNSCWISGQNGAQGPLTYRVLSFREITQ